MHHLTNLAALHNQGGLYTLLYRNEIMVYRTHCQQARNGCPLLVDVTVRENDVVHTFIHTRLCLLAQILDSLSQSTRTFFNVEQHGEFLRLETLVADVAENVQLRVGQHRLWQSHHLAVRSVGREDVRAHRTDILRQAHHQFLTYGVDGRVGHLCKLLTEVVEENLRTVADDCQWRVITHCCYRLLPCSCHGHHSLVDILLTKTEVDEFPFIVLNRVLHMATALQLLQLDAVRREPFAVWMCLGEFLLDFAIIVYLALLRVDEKNLSGLQTSLAHHVTRLEVHHTHFTCHHYHTALGDGVAAGTQTISVQHAASKASVAEEQGSGTIPRLHQDGVILVESLQVFADGVLVVETLRHKNRHCLRQ